MAESLVITNINKELRYQELIPQIQALVAGENDQIANLANVTAALKYTFNWLWVGFYLVKDDHLVLGPFQGPIACTRIKFGFGVCGTSYQKKETIIVPDVNQFPGHIACSSASLSEIVIPLLDFHHQCIGVLDVDSDKYNDFDQIDKKYLEQIILQLIK